MKCEKIKSNNFLFRDDESYGKSVYGGGGTRWGPQWKCLEVRCKNGGTGESEIVTRQCVVRHGRYGNYGGIVC